MKTFSKACAVVGVMGIAAAALADGVVFRVSINAGLVDGPVSGRVFVGVVAPGNALPPGTAADAAPFWDDRQSMYGMDVKGVVPGAGVEVGDAADWAVAKPSALKPGVYTAAARLIAARRTSSWRNDAGNLFGGVVTFTVPEGGGAPIVVDLPLTKITKAREWSAGEQAGPGEGARLVEVKSTLLSEFFGREVSMRAGVVYPTGFDAKAGRRYAAVFEVPGFGGDHFGAVREAKRRQERAARNESSPESRLDRETFFIVLDPESENGHTLFADSANNGPRGRALVEELIPELERRLPLEKRAEARLLRGHSSGGWSTLWLGLTYPDTFGAVWASSPDPVDFRALELVDIYSDASMYTSRPEEIGLAVEAARPPSPTREAVVSAAADWPSFRVKGKVVMTVRAENENERLLGPRRTSGQQWASWQAVWGPREGDGSIAALYDDHTGAIRREVLDTYLKYDIGRQVRTKPEQSMPLLLNRVRLVVGGEDSFYLEQAVGMLKADVEAIRAHDPRAAEWGKAGDGKGYITIVPGKDHGSVFGSEEVKRFPTEMLEHLEGHGLAGK